MNFKQHKILIISSLIFFLGELSLVAQEMKDTFPTGLMFNSKHVNKDKRTSLDLNPNKNLRVKGNMSLSFDVKFKWVPGDAFGYVFRIISNDTTSMDMIVNRRHQKIHFNLNEGVDSKCSYDLDFTPNILNAEWLHVDVRIEKDKVKYNIDNLSGEFSCINNMLLKGKEVAIYFGANRHTNFYTTDVPPMEICNLQIKDDDDVLRNWSLNQHCDSLTYDNIYGEVAKVNNGIWSIDKHTIWNKELTIKLYNWHEQIAYDDDNGRVFIADRKRMYVYHIDDNRTDTVNYKKGRPYLGAGSLIIYDNLDNRLISYSDGPYILTFNFESKEWTVVNDYSKSLGEHHNRLIDRKNKNLVTFGGYGKFQYNSILSIKPLNEDVGDWKQIDLSDHIYPRYLSSIGYIGDGQAMILGGYGSKSGLQEQSPQNYYDIFQVNMLTGEHKLLGELDGLHHICFGNGMIVDSLRNAYVLGFRNDIYDSNVQLYEVDTQTMNYKTRADSIPFYFQDIDSFCDLFYYSKNNKLYAIIYHKTPEKYFEANLYSLSFPPLSKVPVTMNELKGSIAKIPYLLGVCTLIIIISITVSVCYKRTKKKNVNTRMLRENNIIEHKKEEHVSSFISLLGSFFVIDQKGNNITKDFTAVPRQIFLSCLLAPVNTGKHLNSQALANLIWPNMDKTSATNNRNVNINKLRSLLKEVGNISLINDKGYWQVIIEDGVCCDYLEINSLLSKMIENKDFTHLDKMLKLAASGSLLPDMNDEWLDSYKSSYSNFLIDRLYHLLEYQEIKNDLQLVEKVANIILLHDLIDEDAIKLKCYSLHKLGQKGLALQAYNKYCNDYFILLNEKPIINYKDLISHLLSKGL